ncbi:MAG: hypothetical protein ACKVPJ_12045 [Chitinophagales bacterium]
MKKTSLILTIVGSMFLTGAFAQSKTGERGGEKTAPQSTEQGTSDKAQVEKKAQEMAAEWTKMMDEKLKLSADQKQKAMAVNEKYAKQLIELKMKNHNNPNADEAMLKAEKEKITQARFNEYKSFLSKEQMAQFKKERDSTKKEKMEGMSEEEKAQMRENKDEKKEKKENMTEEEKERMEKRKEEKKAEK